MSEMKTNTNEIVLNPNFDDFSSKALVSGIDVLRGTELIKPEDFQFLHDHVAQYEKRFRTRAIYRSKTEMIAGVLNDSEHPTVDSKYWQAIGEQNVQLTELINLSYEVKKVEADNELLVAEIEELEEESNKSTSPIEVKKFQAKIKKKRIELAQAQFGLTQQQKIAQERLREIKHWDDIIEQLEKNLEFGSENFELHHPKRYFLRYEGRMKNLNYLEPSAKESVINHYQAFTKMNLVGENPLPLELALADKKQLENNQEEINQEEITKKNLPPNLTESSDINFSSFDEMVKKDTVAKVYFSKKVRKILIGAPHRTKYDGNVTNFLNLQIPAGFTSSVSEPYGYTTSDAQNYIIQKAIDEDYNYVFFVEDDNLIPKNGLVQLMHHDAEMVGGLYYRKYFPLETACMYYNKEGYPSSLDDYQIGDIINDTLVLCSGCTLIKVSTLKKLEAPWYKTLQVDGRPAITSDTYICQRMREIGVNIITDTGVQCLHIDRTKGILYGHPQIVDYEKNEIRPQWREYFAV